MKTLVPYLKTIGDGLRVMFAIYCILYVYVCVWNTWSYMIYDTPPLTWQVTQSLISTLRLCTVGSSANCHQRPWTPGQWRQHKTADHAVHPTPAKIIIVKIKTTTGVEKITKKSLLWSSPVTTVFMKKSIEFSQNDISYCSNKYNLTFTCHVVC